MKRLKQLTSGLCGAALLSGGVLYGESYEALMLLGSEDHSSAPGERWHAEFIETASGGDFQFSYSYEFETNVLDSNTELNQDQRDLLHEFDLVVMPRRGAGSSSNFGSTDWNEIETPILNMNPFTYGDGNWRWMPAGVDTSTTPAALELVVADSAHPIFDGVDTTDGTVDMWDEGDGEIMQVRTNASTFTGHAVALTDAEEEGASLNHPWIVMWDGSEATFYDGGPEGPAGRRTMFLGEQLRGTDDVNHDPPFDNQFDRYYSDDAQELLLNTYYATVPEPSTYALFGGIGALGLALLVRRFRRKA